MKIEVEGQVRITDRVEKLVKEALKLRKYRGYKDPEFDIFVSRYLGRAVVGTNKKLNLSALDLIAISVPRDKQESIEPELKAFQELLVWSQRLGLNFRILSSLLDLGSKERRSKLKQSQMNLPDEEVDKIIGKLDELEKSLSKVDSLIEKYFPEKLNPSLALVLVEQLENLGFESSHTPAKRILQLRIKSSELLTQLLQAKGNEIKSVSETKAKVDRELLGLFIEVEPEKEIRSKLIAWLFAENSWEKLRDEKYLWTLLARMSDVATRYCNTTWAFIPGQINLFELVVNSKWPGYLDKRGVMENSSAAAKKLVTYPVHEISRSVLFDPFKVDWGLVNEILTEFRDYQAKMYQNSLKSYSKTLQEILNK